MKSRDNQLVGISWVRGKGSWLCNGD